VQGTRVTRSTAHIIVFEDCTQNLGSDLDNRKSEKVIESTSNLYYPCSQAFTKITAIKIFSVLKPTTEERFSPEHPVRIETILRGAFRIKSGGIGEDSILIRN